MSKAEELKAKNENLFERNTILLNENERLQKENAELKHNKKTVAHLADCLEEKMKERIVELEKENTELKAHIKADCIDCADYIKIKKLEEENAEIKAELKDANEKVVHLACNQNKDLKQQLTKAKEIIKDLLNLPFANNEEVYADVTSHLDRAEQFLKEK